MEYVNRGLITINNNQPIFNQDQLDNVQLQKLEQAVLDGDNYYLKALAYRSVDISHEKPYQISTVFLKAVSVFVCLIEHNLLIC